MLLRVLVKFLGSAKSAAENDKYSIYINEERKPVDEYDFGIYSVWVVNKQTGSVRKLFSTNPDAATISYGIESFVPLSQVNIGSVSDILFFPYSDSKIVVSGVYPSFTWDASYIIDLDNATAIGLPISGSVSGFTSNEGYAIGQTWDYYDEGGRYTILKIFDDNGKLRATLSLKNR